jgi:hypothetical protein
MKGSLPSKTGSWEVKVSDGELVWLTVRMVSFLIKPRRLISPSARGHLCNQRYADEYRAALGRETCLPQRNVIDDPRWHSVSIHV